MYTLRLNTYIVAACAGARAARRVPGASALRACALTNVCVCADVRVFDRACVGHIGHVKRAQGRENTAAAQRVSSDNTRLIEGNRGTSAAG